MMINQVIIEINVKYLNNNDVKLKYIDKIIKNFVF